MDINGSTVVVSGASSGIGRATADAIADAGAHPILLARTESDLEAAVAEIKSRGRTASMYPVDLSEAEEVNAVADSIRDDIGVPDAIVNNAGVGRWRAIDETDPEDAELMITVPYLAAFYLTRAFVEDMLARDRGHVVNVTSGAAYFPPPGATAYNVARGAMRTFSTSLRGDFQGTNLGVSLVAAAKVDTDYFVNNPGTEERIPKIAKLFRTLTPERVADSILDAIEAERKRAIVPVEMRVAVFFRRLFPGLLQYATNKTGWRRDR
jgi:short-subunit dehydrogenase